MVHHPHHGQQGPPPTQHLNQHSRPSSIVHPQQHYQQAPPPQHQNSYAASHGLQQYTQAASGPSGQHLQETPYYAAHPSPYSTPSVTSAGQDTPDIMAASQMARPYPPIYHTPNSASPASVASPSGHDQHGRSLYGQPPSHMQQPMYYPPQQQYPPMPAQGAPSPYGQHPQQHNQTLTSQPNMIMHSTGQHPGQHPLQQHQPGMTNSPRTKLEHLPQSQQMQRPPPGPLGAPQQQQHPQHPQQNGPPMNQNNVPGSGVNANAAPGPIPATTPLVVRQDGNGVQWIAFEYSRDRVKMEYTIRCDVESVNVDTLSPDFKTENCVYPRACCSKEQYRGNRLVYETECNTVGWALAELNPSLRGKRGLIQRAVDSWRNSNQDPRLRSRRVRRMAKINTRKQVQAATHNPHMPGPGGPAGMPPSGNMGPQGGMGKPVGGMGGQQLHHHHAHPDGSAPGGPDDGSGSDYDADPDNDADNDPSDPHNHHPLHPQHHHADSLPSATPDLRQHHAFSPYTGGASAYPIPAAAAAAAGAAQPPHMHAAILPPARVGGVAARSTEVIPSAGPAISSASAAHASLSGASTRALHEARELSDEVEVLFGDIPEAKKRKFILVEDPVRGGRTRVRVTLDTIDTRSIPDSYRKGTSVYGRSWFPREMQSPTPSSAGGGSHFASDDADTGAGGKTMVPVPLPDGSSAELGIPRMRRAMREKEVRVNDLGYRMAWHQSRTFAGRIVFLQRSLDCYRNKVRGLLEGEVEDDAAPAAGQGRLGRGAAGRVKSHWETRAGKARWLERSAGKGRGKEE